MDDNYDYQGEYENFDTGDFEDLGDTTDWGGQYNDDYSWNGGDVLGGVSQMPQAPQGFDWSGWDAQANEYLNSPDFYNNNQQYDPNQQYFTDINSGTQFWKNQDGDYAGYMEQGGQYNPYDQSSAGGWDLGSIFKGGLGAIGSALSKGTGGTGSSGATNQMMKTLMGLYAANQEKKSNQRMSSGLQGSVEQQNRFRSPFDVASAGGAAMGGSSMRDAMQQKLAAAMNDPYGQKIVQDQVANIDSMQARKDAAAGRRSNMATSAPAMLAAKADAAYKYQQGLMNAAGANINPYSGGLEQLASALKYGAQGNSPYMSALGYGTTANSYDSNPDMQALLSKLFG